VRRPGSSDGEAPIVLVTFPDYDVDGPQHGGAFTAAGVKMRIAAKRGARSTDELLALCHDAAGAIASTDPFTREVLRDSPGLRVIARVGVGIDSIDVAAATEMGVAIVTTPGANDESVADHTLAMILAMLRRITVNDESVRAGEWNRTGPHSPRQLTGLTVGLVGFGRIGRQVARRLEGFDVELLVSDPIVGHSDPRCVALEELLARSDIVSLHCPLIPATHHLIDEAALHRMQPHAILVNTARGGVVDEGALIRALDGGVIAGAAIDAYEVEPPGESPLMAMTNVLLSPHVGGLSTTSIAEMTRRVTVGVLDVLQDRIPDGLANPAILD
jgi:phosphoglycerate dehydrogenase-like enzyme